MTHPQHDYSSIALVDLSYLFKRNYMGAGVKAPPNAGANQTILDLAHIRDDVDHVILCLDGPPYLRRDRFEAYKAHREEPPPEEIQQKRALIEELKRLGYTAAKVKGYEADDIIATLSRVYSEWCPEVRIYGPDKDVAQCIRANVVQIIPSSGKRQTKRRDAKACHEEYGALPSQMAFWQAIVGDTSDGIPGVKGCGPAAAKTVIRELVGSGRPVTLEALANYLGEVKPEGKPWSLVAASWNNLKLSLDLTTLDPNVPLDTDALLVKRAPDPNAPDSGDVDLFEFEGNHTPPAAPPDDAFDAALESFEPEAPAPLPQPRIGADPNAEAILLAQAIARGDELIRTAVCPDGYSPTAERGVFKKNTYAPGTERAQAAAPPPAPPAAAAPPPANDAKPRASGGEPPKPARVGVKSETGSTLDLVRMPTPEEVASLAIKTYGAVDERLQPRDLRAVWTQALWISKSCLHANFDTPEKAATLIMRAVEMGIPVGTALAGFHIIERKLCASADFIRALAERDENFVYMRKVSADDEHATWEAKHARHPTVDTFTYTIEEARKIPKYWELDRHAKPGNWVIRPREMLTKTAASKLAREVFPKAVMGLYCVEEMGNGIITTVGEAA